MSSVLAELVALTSVVRHNGASRSGLVYIWLFNPRFARAPLNKPHGNIDYCLEMEQTVYLEFALESMS